LLNQAQVSYCVGKKLAEKAIWKFVEEEKPPFTITTCLPCLIFGPPLQAVKDLKRLNWSTDQLYSLFNGTNETIPPTSFAAYVSIHSISPHPIPLPHKKSHTKPPSSNHQIDARDLALAHVLSLTTPAAANKRFLFGHPITYQEIADILKTVPGVKDRLAKDSHEKPPIPKLDMAATDVFGIKWRSKQQTFTDAAKGILEIEKRLL
jgi:nucleoside-diphosphate-sugar epimerase